MVERLRTHPSLPYDPTTSPASTSSASPANGPSPRARFPDAYSAPYGYTAEKDEAPESLSTEEQRAYFTYLSNLFEEEAAKSPTVQEFQRTTVRERGVCHSLWEQDTVLMISVWN